MTERFSTKKLILSVLFAALACTATISAHIPTPGTSGYIHSGDAIVILYGVFLDPVSAFLAVGVGSYMTDLLGGYFIYAPITFVIKRLMAFSVSHICGKLRTRGMSPYAAVAGCGMIDIILVAGGYYLCEILLCGLETTLVSVPGNITQGISGLIISSALYLVLQKPLSMALRA